MKGRYLEVTYRKGKPVSAYLYLPGSWGEKSVKTVEAAPGLLIDYTARGVPIGIELSEPTKVTVDQVNRLLRNLGLATLDSNELDPLRAA